MQPGYFKTNIIYIHLRSGTQKFVCAVGGKILAILLVVYSPVENKTFLFSFDS